VSCPLCDLAPEPAANLWRVYGQRLSPRDVHRLLVKQHPELSVSEAEIDTHFREHPFEQPAPEGKLHRSQALQEGLTTFPRYLFYLFRALYRGTALSQRQIYAMFYLDQAADSPQLQAQMRGELHRLVARNYLYRVYPEQLSAVSYDDPGPFYFIGRQGIPLAEKLEGIAPGELHARHYMTNFQNVEPYHLEKDLRFLDAIVALRRRLYRRTFRYADRELQAHIGIEHWYAPSELLAHIQLPDGRAFNFTPSALLGVRAETRDGSLSTLLPLWLEYDRGIDDIAAVVDNILCYGFYYQHEHYAQTFPRLAEHQNPGPLVILCETPYRRDEVAAALRSVLPDRPVPVYLADRASFCHDPYEDGQLLSPQQPDKSFNTLERLLFHNKALTKQRVFTGTDHLDDPSTRQLLADSAGRTPSTAARPDLQPTIQANFDAWGAG
jgi:hypothetical protein